MSNARNLSNLLGGKTTLSADNVEGVQKKEVTTNTAGLGTGAQADQKFVSGQKSLYLYNGTGWDRVLSGTDGPPQWDSNGSVVAKPKALSTNLIFDGTKSLDSAKVTINVSAADPDGFPVTYTFDQHPSSNNVIDSVSQDSPGSGTFIISPNIMSGESNADQKVNFRVLASDGARVATAGIEFVMNYGKYYLIKRGASSNGWFGTTYGTNYDFGMSSIGSQIDDDNQTRILNEFGEYWLYPTTDFTADIEMWGAAGATNAIGDGNAPASGGGEGGYGGHVRARMSFTNGSVYTIIVGQGGMFGSAGNYGPPAAFGGGGHSGRPNNSGHSHSRGGGGGLTGIFAGKDFVGANDVHAAALLIAGGGGGGFSSQGRGGSGGGTTGSSGVNGGNAGAGGGGTQSAGGSGGSGGYGGPAVSAGKIVGGSSTALRNQPYTGGAGGGGYYGGGASALNNYAGGTGGGGSGYVKSDASITNSFIESTGIAATSLTGPTGRDRSTWGDGAGAGTDTGSLTTNGYTGATGSGEENNISDWLGSPPGRFVIVPV